MKPDLPPYDPETSDLPKIPADAQDGLQLLKRYKISKATFHHRKNTVPFVKGVKKGRRVYFTPQEVYHLDAVHWYIKSGFSLEEVSLAYEDSWKTGSYEVSVSYEPVEDPKAWFEESEEEGEDAEGGQLKVSPQAETFVKDLAAMVVQAVCEIAPKQLGDPFRTPRLLKEAADNNYLLTTKWLAEAMGYSVGWVHSFGTGTRRYGFELRKVGIGKYRVRALTDEELAEEESE